MSQAGLGVPKTSEHKAKIAAAQRRRHAAARALTAVEAFHRGSEEALASGPQSSKQSSKGRGRRSSVRCLSSRNSQGKSLTKTQIMTAYKAELREYRLLQEELGPWTQAFKAQHGRKPGLLDVERTGIEWLRDKFKAYVILRDRLLSDTSILRDKLDVAAPEVANGQSTASGNGGRPTGMKAASYATKLNANAGSAKRSQAQSVATFTAALEYRRQQQALAETAAVSAAAAEAAAAAAALEAATEAALAGAAAIVASQPSVRGTLFPVPGAVAAGEMQGQGVQARHGAQQQPPATQNGPCIPHNEAQHTQHAQRAGQLQTAQESPHQNGARHSVVPQSSSPSRNGRSLMVRRDAQSNGVGRPSLIGSQVRMNGSGAVPSRLESAASGDAQASAAQQPASAGSKGDSDRAHNRELPHSETSPSASQAEVLFGVECQDKASSASSVADDAMAAAIASIPSQKAEGAHKVQMGGKAIPAPSPNTSPRVKSALLAAQEYRKLKAAKTAALAVAAATAAAAARTKPDVGHG